MANQDQLCLRRHNLFGVKLRAADNEAKQLDAEQEVLVREIAAQRSAIAQLRLEEPQLVARCDTNEQNRIDKRSIRPESVRSVQRRAAFLSSANERTKVNHRDLGRFVERLRNRATFLAQRVSDQQLVVVSCADGDSGDSSRVVEPRSMVSCSFLKRYLHFNFSSFLK